MYNPQRGRELSDEALALARQLQDHAAEAKILWHLGLLYGTNNDGEQAISFGEQSLALALEHHVTEQVAYTRNDLGRL